jgi:uncharacterized protein with NAD-binding domain and iron-sulfur cluster
VAIVGGGCAALAAAWQLSRLPGYEIHIYEKSWRLGGKGASGRDDEGRILEHGLHIWLGFYENAFRMMRECYAQVENKRWGPEAAEGSRLAHGSLDAAFFPEPHIGVAVRDTAEDSARRWAIWSGYLPPAKGMPGEPLDAETNPFTLENYLVRCYELIKTLMLSVIGPGDVAPQAGELDLDYACDPARTPAEIVAWAASVLRGAVATVASVLHQAVLVLQRMLEAPGAGPPLANMRTFQVGTAVLEQARKLLGEVAGSDPALRRKLDIIDIVIAIAVGLYRNRLLFNRKGFDAINDIDYRQWLKDQGANPRAVDSEFITGIYDLTFAYENGTCPKLAAGVALRGALRMFFTYRGAMFWRMRSGMGDAVFAPLYKVLLEKGNVHFHFRHTLDKVELETIGEDRYVKALTFTTRGAPEALDALQSGALDHFGCWPADPRRFGKAGDERGSVVRQRGEHFDAVILATGAGDFVDMGDRCGLFDQLPDHWKDMRKNLSTAATQSAQVWLAADLEQLGWQRGSGIMTALCEPYETWADMTHTLATEKAWRLSKDGPKESKQDDARCVAYFCAVVPDEEAREDAQAKDRARNGLERLLESRMAPFWPDAFTDGGSGARRAISTHVQANWQGSDRYTLSLPGSIRFRISPLERSVMNMTIAGDWTASGLDAGCVEGAVMSGMLAAFAISNVPSILDGIVGYDHP